MKNSFKLLFLFSLFLGTLISISSSSWFSIWVGLEINLLSFIPLAMKLNNSFSSEASLKYFLIQALASSILLFSIIFFSIFEWLFIFNSKNLINFIIFSSLALKSGIAPFHSWFPIVMEGLSWTMNLTLMTWQKLAPLVIVSFVMNYYFFFFIFFSTMVGSLGGLNQSSARKLLAYSSINHLAWMLAAMMNNELIWFTYFCVYFFISTAIIFFFLKFSIFWISQLFSNFKMKKINKLFFFIPLLSLGGLPPFLGFFPKWITIEFLMIKNFIFVSLILIFFSLITLFYYIRIIYSILLLNYNKMNFKNFNFILESSPQFLNLSNFKKNFLLMFFSFFSLTGLITTNFLIF